MLRKLEKYLSISKASSDSKKAKSRPQVTPTGCFSVYVGPEKRRFVIKTEYVNHPLFKMLLEDAELEYGFRNDGPLQLPCEVDLFCKVLAEMESGEEFEDRPPFGFGYGSCGPFSPVPRVGRSGCSSYGRLAQPRLLKINHFGEHSSNIDAGAWI